MPDYTDFQNLTASAAGIAIEKAVQALFVAVAGANFVAPLNEDDPNREKWTAGAGNIALYTNFNELVFQDCRPRVKIRLHDATALPHCAILDANGNMRAKAWRGQFDFGIVTEMNYTAHTTLRSMVDSIIPTVLPQIAADNSLFATTGINALLTNFQVSEFYARSFSTDIGADKEQGIYYSMIPCDIAFSVRPDKWAAGNQTN